MWQGQTWATRKETLLLLGFWIVVTSLTCMSHGPSLTDWLTKPSQVLCTGNPTNLSSSIHFIFLLTYSPETVKSIIIPHEA